MSEFDTTKYWETRLSTRFNLGGVGYIGLGQRYNGWVYRVRDRVISKSIVRHLGRHRDARVLDVGSGTGFYLRLWRRLGFAELTGSDLTETSVTALQAEFPDLAIVRFDLGGPSLPLPETSFDVISAIDVLPHIVEDTRYRRAIANCARLLNAGGWLMITDYLAPREHRDQHEVVRTADEVQAALADAGFQIVEITPLFVIMNNPICARPMYSRLWRVMVAPAHLHESLGWLLGAILYPIERVLTRGIKNGPSAKLIVCRRR
jgi:SAM-dependent methyltransferase